MPADPYLTTPTPHPYSGQPTPESPSSGLPEVQHPTTASTVEQPSSGRLPVTGTDVMITGTVGLGLVLAGLVALLVSRRKKRDDRYLRPLRPVWHPSYGRPYDQETDE